MGETAVTPFRQSEYPEAPAENDRVGKRALGRGCRKITPETRQYRNPIAKPGVPGTVRFSNRGEIPRGEIRIGGKRKNPLSETRIIAGTQAGDNETGSLGTRGQTPHAKTG
jgi:hypothetical protein